MAKFDDGKTTIGGKEGKQKRPAKASHLQKSKPRRGKLQQEPVGIAWPGAVGSPFGRQAGTVL